MPTVPRPARPAPRAEQARQACPTRGAVLEEILEVLDVLSYMRMRWAYDPQRSKPEEDPALYAHCWRALGRDCEAAVDILTRLRETAVDEAVRLDNLNGDTPRD